MSLGTKTSSRRTSSLSAPASSSLPQKGWTLRPGASAGTRASASSGSPSRPWMAMLAVSMLIDAERLHGFFEPERR